MELVAIWVEGHTAMLQNKASEEALAGKTRKQEIADNDDPRNIAEKGVYRLPNGQLAVPGAAFARMLREAGGAHKSKGSRKSLKYLMPAVTLILDDLCPLFLKDRKTPLRDFEIDSRPVTIPATKGRVMRHRARFNEWTCRVNLRINDKMISPALVRQIFNEGLEQIGIGDYRPEKGGPFGVASIVDWQVVEQPSLTAAQIRNSA